MTAAQANYFAPATKESAPALAAFPKMEFLLKYLSTAVSLPGHHKDTPILYRIRKTAYGISVDGFTPSVRGTAVNAKQSWRAQQELWAGRERFVYSDVNLSDKKNLQMVSLTNAFRAVKFEDFHYNPTAPLFNLFLSNRTLAELMK